MKRIPRYTKICAALSFVALAMLGSPLRASITNITHTDYVMDSITIDGIEYLPGDIALGQLDSVFPASGASIGEIRSSSYDAGSATTTNINAASSSLTFGTFGLNIAAGSVFQFGRTIDDSDTIFLLEIGPAETATQTLELVDAGDSVIGSYTFDFVGADFTDDLVDWTTGSPGTEGVSYRTTSNGIGTADIRTMGGLSLTLADFGVAPGAVTTATGIRFQNSGGYDTAIAGLVAIPEPSALAMMLTFGGIAVLLRRRR